MTKNIAVIPARGGSKRLPNKNILTLGGKPLVAHSILYAKNNLHLIEEVYVSTDNDQIKEIALKYGAKIIDRPDALSGDYQTTASALQHALGVIDEEVDHVFLLQPTNPLRPVKLMEEAFSVYTEGNYDSLMTVTRVSEKFGKITGEGFVPYNYVFGERTQDIEPLYAENGLLYITRANFIKEGIILAEKNLPFVVNSPYSKVDIDTEEDLKYAQFLLETNT